MKKLQPSSLRFRLVVIVGGLLCVAAGTLVAQDALRTAVRGDRSYETRNAPTYRPRDERMRIGPVGFDVSVYYGLEWNDNIDLSPTNPESDVIHRPGINLRGVWPATKDSSLSFGMGIGYEKYMDRSELDGLSISPDSELAWDIPIRDWVITFHDRVSYSQDVISEGGLSGTAQFPRIENTVGVRTRWQPSRYAFEAGYAHFNFIADSSGFDYLTRTSEQFFGRVAYHLAAITRAGVEVSAAITDYDSEESDDNQNMSVGPFVEWQLMRDLRLGLRGGYVIYSTDSGVGTSLKGNFDTYYFGLSADHQLTEFVSHGLYADRSAQQGINQGSGITTRLNLGYNVSWEFLSRATLSVNSFYEHSTESQTGGEEYDRFGARVRVNFRFTDRVGTNLGYNFTTKASDSASRDYEQNSVTFSASYRF